MTSSDIYGVRDVVAVIVGAVMQDFGVIKGCVLVVFVLTDKNNFLLLALK